MASVCDGVTVLDFSQGMAGSMATMVLGDNGAEVIKVEPPGGDPGRSIPAWLMWNRGKKSIVLDPSTEGDREVIYGLVHHADVLVESFRPGSADRMGIGFDRLASVNPQLVYCSITAMGSTGAYKNMAPYDAVVEAKAGGFLQTRPGSNAPAMRVRPNPSYATANQVVQAIVAALRARDNTGRGQRLETSLYQGFTSYDSFSALQLQMQMGLLKSKTEGQALLGVRHLPLTYMVSRCKDGQWLQFTCNTQRLFDSWMQAIGLGDIFDDERFKGAPYATRNDDEVHALREIIAEKLLGKNIDEWLDIFVEQNVAADRFLTTQQFMDYPQTIHNGGVVEIDDPWVGPTKQIGPIVRFSETPSKIGQPAPLLGQHTDELRKRAKAPAAASPATVANSSLKHPFEGLLLLDFSTHLASPMGASLVADLGARVIKIESFTGDEFRSRTQGRARTFQGKESMVINLKTEEGQRIIHSLAARADGLVHNMRGDVPKRLGIDYETLSKINPRLVYLYAGSYGSTGPGAGRAAFHPTAGALSGGALWQLGRGNEPPAGDESMELEDILRVGEEMSRANEGSPDVTSALAVGTALALALYNRERTGKGQYLETSMLISNGYMCSDDFLRYEGKPPRLEADRYLRGIHALHRLYQTAEGWVFLSCPTQGEWEALCRAIGREDLPTDHRFVDHTSRLTYNDQLIAILADSLSHRTADEWEEHLTRNGAGCARADKQSSAAFFLTDPSVKENGFIVATDHPTMGEMMRQGPAVQFSLTPCKAEPAPSFGEDTSRILAELGFKETDITALRSGGVIQ